MVRATKVLALSDTSNPEAWGLSKVDKCQWVGNWICDCKKRSAVNILVENLGFVGKMMEMSHWPDWPPILGARTSPAWGTSKFCFPMNPLWPEARRALTTSLGWFGCVAQIQRLWSSPRRSKASNERVFLRIYWKGQRKFFLRMPCSDFFFF